MQHSDDKDVSSWQKSMECSTPCKSPESLHAEPAPQQQPELEATQPFDSLLELLRSALIHNYCSWCYT